MSYTADVVIIGAGLLGLSAGYWLTKAGAKVIIIDKGQVGWEASSRATGFLSLRGEDSAEIELAAEANRLWLTLDEELGYNTEWLAGGRLWVAIDEVRWAELQAAFLQWQKAGLPVRLLSPVEAREIAPCLTDQVVGAVHTDRGGHANPQRTSQAFAWAFQSRQGQIFEHTPASGIVTRGGKVTGVETPIGTFFADTVVSCAGPQSALIGQMVGVDVPIASARMEAAVTAPLPPLFVAAMVGHGLSVRQTRRGNLHFNGGPHEWVDVNLTDEPTKPTTPLIRNMSRRLTELFPSVSHIQLLRTWAGIVEVTPDYRCIIDRLRSPEGMVIASASGHGFGLSPSIGRAISQLVLDGVSPFAARCLSLDRFANLNPDWRVSRQWVPGAYNT